jgi:hypothetical protein
MIKPRGKTLDELFLFSSIVFLLLVHPYFHGQQLGHPSVAAVRVITDAMNPLPTLRHRAPTPVIGMKEAGGAAELLIQYGFNATPDHSSSFGSRANAR